MSLLSLTSIALAFFIVAVSPGPANLSNATIAMSKGRKISLIYATGLSLGLVFWGLIAISGMGAILQSSVYVLMVLKVLGGLYLLWLAYGSWRSVTNNKSSAPDSLPLADHEHSKPVTQQHWLWRGLLLNLSNPKSVVAWMAAISVGLPTQANISTLLSALTVCILVGFMVNYLYSLLFSLGPVMKVYRNISDWVTRMTAIMFAAAGFGLIRSAFNRNPA